MRQNVCHTIHLLAWGLLSLWRFRYARTIAYRLGSEAGLQGVFTTRRDDGIVASLHFSYLHEKKQNNKNNNVTALFPHVLEVLRKVKVSCQEGLASQS